MGKIFGGSKQKTNTTSPTGFKSLPVFGREAFEDVIARGTELSEDPGLFEPVGLTGEQRAALSTLSAGTDQTSAGEFATGLETFYNPYEEQVVQNAIGDILEQGAGMQSDISTIASGAGGFGGTRQALLESELMSEMLDKIADISASTRSVGFENAANRVLGDIARSQEVAGNVFGLGDTERQIQTAQRQSPLSALQYLSGLTTTLPTGGGTVSTSRTAADPINSLGKLATGLGAFGTGFGLGG